MTKKRIKEICRFLEGTTPYTRRRLLSLVQATIYILEETKGVAVDPGEGLTEEEMAALSKSESPVFLMQYWGVMTDDEGVGEPCGAVGDISCGTPCCLMGHALSIEPGLEHPDADIVDLSDAWDRRFKKEGLEDFDHIISKYRSSDPLENANRVLVFLNPEHSIDYLEELDEHGHDTPIPKEKALDFLRTIHGRLYASLN